MGVIDDINNKRPLKQRQRFDYIELKQELKDLKKAGAVKVDLRSNKKTLLSVYNEMVERYMKLLNKYQDQQREKAELRDKIKVIKKVKITKRKNKKPVLKQDETQAVLRDKIKVIKKVKITKRKNKKPVLRRKQRTFIVLVDVNEIVIYKNDPQKKEYKVKPPRPLEQYVTVSRKSEVNDILMNKLNNIYPMEDAYTIRSLQSYSYIIKETHKKVKAKDVPMKKAIPYNVSFLKYFENIDPISYENSEGECVLRTLKRYFKIRRDKTLIKSFEKSCQRLYNKPFELKNGITGSMIYEFCKERNISCLGLDQRTRMFVKNVADKYRGRAYRQSLIFYMCMGHMYIITDENAIRSLSSTFSNGNTTFKSSLEIHNDEKKENKTYHKQRSLAEAMELKKNDVIIYNQSNLNEIYNEYVKLTNDLPKIQFSSITSISSMTIKNGATLVCSAVYSENLDWEIIKDVCEDNDIIYNNQGIGTLLIQLQGKLYTKNRKAFTPKQRETIKNEQNNKCNDCKDELKKTFHIDHIQPLSSGGNNERDNLQALCVSCHLEKTKQENEACEYILMDKFISGFNIEALNVIKSNHFRKVAFSENLDLFNIIEENLSEHEDKKVYGCDIVKCRRNLLLYSKSDFARYSVLDNIEPFDGKLTTGFYYIRTCQGFPLRGNGFYSLPMIEYALKHNLIVKGNIIYQFKPSMTIKHNEFNELVNYILTAFNKYPSTGKLAINSLIGLYGRRNGSFIQTNICDKNNFDDIGHAYETLNKPYLVNLTDSVVAVNSLTEIEKLELHYPIHAQIVDLEAIESHKLMTYINNNGGLAVQVKTDCINYVAEKKIDFDGFYWDDEKTIKKYHEEDAKPLQRSVNIQNTDIFELEERKYSINSITDDVDDIIDSNKGLLILGMAGTGKTYLTNKIIDKLENMNKKIIKLASTNKASLYINGMTLDKFSFGILNGSKGLNRFKSVDYIIVDEISMVKEIFYQVLLSIKKYNPNIKFIIVGDFGQLPPVKDRIKSADYENSRCLYELVDGRKLTLNRCMRSDKRLFNDCLRVRNLQPINLLKYPVKEKTYLNVSYTNQTRKIINDECYKRWLNEYKPEKTAHIQALTYDNNSQKYTVAKGMPLIARVNLKSLGIVNNESWTVLKINKNDITVINDLKNEVNVAINRFNRVFHLAFCITVHKSQGATFNKKYTIYDWHMMNRKLSYVSLSRGTKPENIQIHTKRE